MFSIFTHFMKPVRDTNNEPVLPVVKTLFCPVSLYVFSCMNSTYLLTSEERRERERQRARTNRRRASEEESCGKFMKHLETCLLVAEADSFVSPSYISAVFLHCICKMKYSYYQDSFVILGWLVYWVFG